MAAEWRVMNIGVVFSPGAGKETLFFDVSAALKRFFIHSLFYTPKGVHGSNYFSGAYEVSYHAGKQYIENLNNLLEALLAKNLELLITVGGDGIAAYCANYIIDNHSSITLMGISAGTTNVGPIARVKIPDLTSKKMIYQESVSAIKVLENGKTVCHGFHDIVIGNTILGTIDNKIQTLSAKAMIDEGKKQLLKPSMKIVNENFTCYLNHDLLDGFIKPAQIIISSTKESDLFGKAIHGVFCFHQSINKLGAMVFADKPLVRPQICKSEIEAFTNVSQILFGAMDTIILEGFSEDAYLIVDGNPYKKISSQISLRYIEKAINISTLEIS